MHSMKEHWQCQHRWSIQGQVGGLNTARQGWIQAQKEQACQAVWCQQVFPTCQGSHYIHVHHVRNGLEENPDGEGPLPEDAIQRCIEQMQMCWQEEQAQAMAPVEPGDQDKANPWLWRAGWAVYLAHTNVPSAVASM